MKQKRNMLIYFFGKMIPATAVLFIMVFGVRFLGKSEFGRYNLLFNCINIAVTFFVGWIQQSMLRFNTGTAEELGHHRKQFICFSMFSAMLCSVSIFSLTIFYFHEPLLNGVIVAAFVFCLTLLTVHLTYQQSQFHTVKYVVTESLYYVVTVIGLSVVMFFSFPKQMICFYAAWLVAGAGWMLVDSVADSKVVLDAMKSKLDKEFLKKTFNFGYLITGWLMISNLFNVVDRFIIRHYYDFEQVGIYSVVYDLIYRVSAFAAMPVLLTLHPLIMKMWNEDRKTDALALIRKAVLLLMLLLVAEIVGYLIFGNWIFDALFHLDTPDLMVIMVPLIISSILWQAALFLHKPMEILFRQKQMIAGILLSLISNTILNFIFVPRYGYQAAAYTTLASTLVYVVFVVVMTGSYKKLAA